MDINGDGKFNTDDKMILGNTYPTWTGSLSSRVDYRGFDLSVQAITRRDFMIRNDLIRGATLAGRYNSPAENFWTPNNPSQTTPRPDKNTENPVLLRVARLRGRLVPEDPQHHGRCDRFRQRFIQRVGAQSMRIYFTAQDPWLFTNIDGARSRGSDRQGCPRRSARFLIGGSFGF